MTKRKGRDKLLAEWFWTDRWMGSSAFLLPQEPRGIYREMLTQAWMRGARLPNDHEAIRRATGTTAAEWRRCWPLLERYWRVDGNDLVNDTQAEVYSEAKAAAEKASERGRRGAQARAQAGTQADTQAPAHAQHKRSTSSTHAPLERMHKDNPPSPSRTTATTATTAAAAKPTNGHSERGLSKSFLSPDEHARTIAECDRLLDEIMARNPDQDRAWLLRQHSTVKGSGAYIVRPDTAKHEHLVRTVQALRDTADKLKRAESGEKDGLLTVAEHERRRQG